jgi:hypothetical protein
MSIVLVLVGACRQPSDTAGPPASVAPAPGGTPVAPAIEPGQPTPEHSIELPGASPVAPAIEPERPSPEPPIEYDGRYVGP